MLNISGSWHSKKEMEAKQRRDMQVAINAARLQQLREDQFRRGQRQHEIELGIRQVSESVKAAYAGLLP